MPFIANTDRERQEMLSRIGVESFEELISAIPEEVRMKGSLNLPPGLGEAQLISLAEEKAFKNQIFPLRRNFLGAGLYPHFIPPLVLELISRGEFYTAYTPYQPEASQGELQGMYEFQTYIAILTGMEVANSGGYDGATSFADALLMAHNINRRERFIIAETVHPHYRHTFATYNLGPGFGVSPLPLTEELGWDLNWLEEMLSGGEVSAVAVQQPDLFGTLHPGLDELAELCHRHGTLLVVAWNLLAASQFEPPGAAGADIVVGEVAGLGTPVSFGGPLCGYLATRTDYIRKMPGRLVGEAKTADGKRAFILVLQTREQHIRRAKATSNICTNEALVALMFAIYMSTLGRDGFNQVGRRVKLATDYAAESFARAGMKLVPPEGVRMNEIAVWVPGYQQKRKAALSEGILAGTSLAELGMKGEDLLSRLGAPAGEVALIAFNELMGPEDIDRLVELMAG